MAGPSKAGLPDAPNAQCPKCREPVYCLRLRGHPVYLNKPGWPWPKHGCTDRRRPRLRSKPFWFETNGWFPLIIKRVEIGPIGMIIHGLSLSTPTIRHFGVLEVVPSLQDSRLYFRATTTNPEIIELRFYLPGEVKPRRVMGYDRCLSLNDLRSRASPK